MKIFLGVILMAAAYFIGSISTASILAKAKGVDIREEGSGNPGTTNVLRVLGKKYAAICLIGDILKGVISVLLGALVAPVFAYACGVMAVIGHCFPFMYGFKGGKGVATSVAVIFTIKPTLAVILLICFIIVVAITKYVSLGSIIAAFIAPALTAYMVQGFFWFALILACIVILKHRANIKRLINGEEPKLELGGKK